MCWAAVTAESRAGADDLSSARRLGPTLSARLPGIQQDGGMALAGSDDKNQERRAEGGIIFHGSAVSNYKRNEVC